MSVTTATFDLPAVSAPLNRLTSLTLSRLVRMTAARGKYFKFLMLAAALLLVLALGLVDWLGGLDIDLFFLLPIYFSTRILGRAGGLFIATASAAAALTADVLHGDDPSLVLYWNGAALLAIFAVVVFLLDALRQSHTRLEVEVDQRTLELEQANVELKMVQFRVIESARMESVGRIAAGIAHDVKNPLMTITMAADYLAQVVPKDDIEAPIMLQDMRAAIDRANRVISELLEFSRPAELSLQLEDFQQIAEHSLGLMRLELRRRHINVVRRFTGATCLLPLDKNKIEQVLINLFMNAIQAMPDNGTLTIATQPSQSGTGLRVDIEDTGPGISQENLWNIQQPYFTTKSAGQGTGLGLAVSRNIVKLHGGSLTMGNCPGGGARATIEFIFSPGIKL